MRTTRTLALLTAPLLLSSLLACGSTVSSSGGGGSTTSSSSPSSSGTGGSSSGSGGGSSGPTVTFAITKLYLGDTNPDGSPNPGNAWKQYGYNLDGVVSDASSQGLCQPYGGAKKSAVYPDGNNGIDNSFGKNVLPIFSGISADFAQHASDGYTAGKYTTMFSLVGLGQGGDQASLQGRVTMGAPLAMPPAFNGSDTWPVDASSLSNAADTSSAKVTFPDGTMSNNGWYGHANGPLIIHFGAQGSEFTLSILDAIVDLELDADHQTATGMLGGVIDAAALAEEMRRVAGTFDPSLCSGPTIESIVNEIKQEADILDNGKQDSAQTCQGISIGLGFDAVKVLLGAPVAVPAPPDPCK
ncbi:MAG: hypothetical protein U0359_30575 [Byssovorax sp.]